MKRPGEVFTSSPRRFPSPLPELSYPLHDDVVTVTRSGQIYIAGVGTVSLTTSLGGYDVGIREEEDGRWLVSFADLDLAHVDRNHGVTPIAAEAVATP